MPLFSQRNTLLLLHWEDVQISLVCCRHLLIWDDVSSYGQQIMPEHWWEPWALIRLWRARGLAVPSLASIQRQFAFNSNAAYLLRVRIHHFLQFLPKYSMTAMQMNTPDPWERESAINSPLLSPNNTPEKTLKAINAAYIQTSVHTVGLTDQLALFNIACILGSEVHRGGMSLSGYKSQTTRGLPRLQYEVKLGLSLLLCNFRHLGFVSMSVTCRIKIASLGGLLTQASDEVS